MKMMTSALMIMTVIMLFSGIVITPVRASIVGNTYTFAANWLTETVQQDNGVVYSSSVDGQFAITIINTTEIGGDDAYLYNYRGFMLFGGAKTYTDANDTVTFINQKVYFVVTTTDSDHDNRSESVSLQMFPQTSLVHPGREFFVNPIWSTHTSDWNTAVDNLEDNPLIDDIIESAGEGTFQLQFKVEIESIDPNLGEMNGTATFKFLISFDDDGILMSFERTITVSMHNENHTLEHSMLTKITRASGIASPGFGIDIGMPLVYIGAASIVGLVIGLGIGKKYF